MQLVTLKDCQKYHFVCLFTLFVTTTSQLLKNVTISVALATELYHIKMRHMLSGDPQVNILCTNRYCQLSLKFPDFN